MSNLSLKDQLQALSLGQSSESAKPKQDRKGNHNKRPNHVRATTQKPTWLEHAQYGVELLKAHFPSCFRELKEVAPLKIGIKQDLVKHLSGREDIAISDKACMVSSLAYYVNSIVYHKSMLPGSVRIDLDGQPVGTVTVEEAQYSADCRKAKLNKKQAAVQSNTLSKDELLQTKS